MNDETHFIILQKACSCGEDAELVEVMPHQHRFLCLGCALRIWGEEIVDQTIAAASPDARAVLGGE